MTKSIKYMGVSGKYTKNGTPKGFTSITPFITVNGGMVFGVCYGDNTVEASQFPYLIAATYEKGEIPVGYSVKEIPEYTWAIFRCVGAMPRAIQALWSQIYTEFFPTSEYRPVNGVDLEAYYEGNMDYEKYISEIWIPVERKYPIAKRKPAIS